MSLSIQATGTPALAPRPVLRSANAAPPAPPKAHGTAGAASSVAMPGNVGGEGGVYAALPAPTRAEEANAKAVAAKTALLDQRAHQREDRDTLAEATGHSAAAFALPAPDPVRDAARPSATRRPDEAASDVGRTAGVTSWARASIAQAATDAYASTALPGSPSPSVDRLI